MPKNHVHMTYLRLLPQYLTICKNFYLFWSPHRILSHTDHHRHRHSFVRHANHRLRPAEDEEGPVGERAIPSRLHLVLWVFLPGRAQIPKPSQCGRMR